MKKTRKILQTQYMQDLYHDRFFLTPNDNQNDTNENVGFEYHSVYITGQ